MNYMRTAILLAGFVGHELGHVRNRDTLTMTITATIAGAISMLAQFGMFSKAANATITVPASSARYSCSSWRRLQP